MINKIYRITIIALAITMCTQITAAEHDDFSKMPRSELKQRQQQLIEQRAKILKQYYEEPIISCGPFSIFRKLFTLGASAAATTVLSAISLTIDHFDKREKKYPFSVLGIPLAFGCGLITYEALTALPEKKPEMITIKNELQAIQRELCDRNHFHHAQKIAQHELEIAQSDLLYLANNKI